MSDRTQRRRPTIAKEWQLAVLKKLQSESENPTEEQRLAVVAETGLDEKWVRNWFTRQRSKLAARNRKDQPPTTDSPTVATFKLQLCYPPLLLDGPPPHRSSSTPVDPTPNCSPNHRSPTASPHPPGLTVNEGTPLNDPPPLPSIPTYSRNPLSNRYPDFSQFFRPQGLWRPHAFELPTPIRSHNFLTHRLPEVATNLHVSAHFQGLHVLDPHPLGGFAMDSNYPVAFSVKLVDLLGST